MVDDRFGTNRCDKNIRVCRVTVSQYVMGLSFLHWFIILFRATGLVREMQICSATFSNWTILIVHSSGKTHFQRSIKIRIYSWQNEVRMLCFRLFFFISSWPRLSRCRSLFEEETRLRDFNGNRRKASAFDCSDCYARGMSDSRTWFSINANPRSCFISRKHLPLWISIGLYIAH